MKRHIKTLICFLLLSMPLLSFASDAKIYVQNKQIDGRFGKIHIHRGHNLWIETDFVQCDEKGVFTLDSHIVKDANSAYQQVWRCPYCHRYWPVGEKCQNPECPSKY